MRIAITGHTAGIGRALTEILTANGHTVVGISKRDGNNIRNIPKIVPMIADCDMWINNAQSGYAQTELLFKICEAWKDHSDKLIWVISTMMAVNRYPIDSPALEEYANQKRALEEAFYQLVSRYPCLKMMLIRPGAVATQPGQEVTEQCASPQQWAQTLVDLHNTATETGMFFREISLNARSGIPSL